MNKKEKSFIPVFVVLIISLLIASFWDKIDIIKNTAHKILNPSAGVLLEYNLILGMILLTFIIAIFMTIIQKYTTDQEELKKLKKDQKAMQEEMKKYKQDPQKIMELQKKQMQELPETFMKTFKLGMRPIIYTGIPLILFIRWFYDYFASIGTSKIFGIHWIIVYIILTMIFTGVLRKILKVH
ncbi:MAG: EMC3/TMCO1 family protein [Nanoarchaeota archaeon]